jgi:hypothetical protein
MSRSMSFGWLTCLFAAAAALAACGGGDDTPAPAPSTYTQAEVLISAKLGALTAGISQQRVPFLLAFFGGFLQASSTDDGGSGSFELACAGGGTRTIVIVKSAPRVGFAVGDSITTTNTNCVLNGYTFNGTATLTAKTAIANLPAASYAFDYTAELVAFSIGISTLTTVHDGTISATSRADNSNVYASTLQVPSARSYSSVAANLKLEYAPGTTLTETETVSSSSGTLSIAGTVTVSTGSTALPVLLATPTALAGPVSATGTMSMTAGTLEAKDMLQNIATSMTFAGTTAAVRADSDQNGSLDLSFASSWAALTGL